MTSLEVGNDEKPLDDASPDWVVQQIERRRRDGIAVCVVVSIRATDLNMHLSTLECARGAGGGRPPNARECVVLELWQKYGLNTTGFAAGHLSSHFSHS